MLSTLAIPPRSRRRRSSFAMAAMRLGASLSMLTASTIAFAQPPLPWRPVAPEVHRAPLPRDPANEAARLARLGEGFRIESTAHFSLAVHEENRSAAYRGKILEDVHAAFTRLCEELGLPLRRPATAHALVFTPTRERLVEMAGIPDLPADIEGLYVHASREGLFYAPLGRREVRAALARGRRLQGDLAALRRRIAALSPGSTITLSFRNAPNQDFTREEALALVDEEIAGVQRGRADTRYDRGQWSLETMTHEAAHQLSYEMDLFSKDARPPVWLTEGFAMLFEPSRNGFLLETRRPHWGRWAALDERHREGVRTDLRDLVDDDALLRRFETASSAYDDAWSLVYFLMTEEAEAFARYVASVRSARVNATAAARREHFERIFGAKLPTIETRWREFVDDLGRPESD